LITEKDRQRLMERQRKEQRRAERLQLKAEQRRVEATVGQKLGSHFDPETMEDEHAVPSSAAAPSAEVPLMLHSQHEPAPRPAHAQAHDVSHGEPVSSRAKSKKFMYLSFYVSLVCHIRLSIHNSRAELQSYINRIGYALFTTKLELKHCSCQLI
jgi:hypothetical protein